PTKKNNFSTPISRPTISSTRTGIPATLSHSSFSTTPTGSPSSIPKPSTRKYSSSSESSKVAPANLASTASQHRVRTTRKLSNGHKYDQDALQSRRRSTIPHFNALPCQVAPEVKSIALENKVGV